MVISFLNGRVKDKLQHCFCFLDIYWLEDENYTKQSVFVHYREENIIFNLVSELWQLSTLLVLVEIEFYWASQYIFSFCVRIHGMMLN